MQEKKILMLCAAGMLTLSAVAAPAAKAPAAKAPAKTVVKVDPFSVLPEKLAEIKGKTLTREDLKAFCKEMSPNGQLPEQLNAQWMQLHGYELLKSCIEYRLLLNEVNASKSKMTDAQIRAKIEGQFNSMPKQLRDMMAKQLESRGSSIAKHIDKMISNPQVRQQIIIEDFLQKNVFNKLTVSEATVKKYYDANKEKYFTIPADTAETMRASHILVMLKKGSDGKAELAKANKLLAQLKKNPKDFESLAAANSDCPSKQNKGSLGAFGKGQMVPEFEKAVIALKPGQISGIVKTQFGYHIIRRDFPRKAELRPYAMVKNEIKTYLLEQEKQNAWVKYQKSLEKKAGVKIFLKAPAAPKASAAVR